ncbi:major capsid protein [Peromfec virus RodF5_3]|uniref:Major capsid protein n=1 Tax=Peromfec virus RodF5_3 TaxID=2929339 RepID=A0A976R7F7_9VIRU|nr:major capsid protein [Peromfec virus RodF5_3]
MTNISGLETFDSGSNYKFNNEQPTAVVPRDLFDLSHLHTTSINNAGEVIPILFLETVPGDSFEVNVSNILRVLPQVVPPYSGQRGYVHLFGGRYSDLFDYAGEYITKGYTGTSVKKKPVMTASNMGSYWTKKIAPGDLLDYLGLPQGYSPEELTAVLGGVSILPVFMYWKIVNQFYRNKNTQINDRVRLPNSFDELRLNDKSELISNKHAGENSQSVKVTFGALEYRDWTADYFTSGFPSPQRGNAPTMEFSSSAVDIPVGTVIRGNRSSIYSTVSPLPVTFLTSDNAKFNADGYGFIKNSNPGQNYGNDFTVALNSFSGGSDSTKYFLSDIGRDSNSVLFTTTLSSSIPISVNSSGSLSLEDIRSLAIQSDELERMAKTDGTWAAFGRVFFGVTSRNAMDYQITYIGGSYQQIQFSEVLQNSATQTDSSGNPTSVLGQYAGHGISAQTSGYLGHYDCDEHGFIMALFSIMPDTYYHQGVDRVWTTLLQEEEFLPQREKMGLAPVYNRELYFSKDKDSSGQYKANDLLVYQAPFDYLRFRANRISGKIADPNSKDFYPYTQARKFTATPNWNADFLKANNIRKDYLYAGTEVAYTAQFRFNIRAVRPLPYFHQSAQVLN